MTSTLPVTSVDVSAFGAVNDGETDDTAAIQAATDYAIANKLSLAFGPGSFLVSKPITINGPASWQGFENGTKIVTSGVNTLITILATSDVNITGVSFQGSGDNRSTSSPLLVAYKANDLTLTKDSFSSNSGIAALLSNVNDTTVSQCAFSHIGNNPDLSANAQAVAFTTDLPGYGTGNGVANSLFSNIGLDAISATGQDGFSACQNSIGRLRATDAWRNEPQAPAGIYMNYDRDVTISNNIIEDAAGNGIDVFNTQRIAVNDNYVSRNGSSGIALSSTSNGSIVNNTSLNNDALQAWVFNAGITVGDHPGNSASGNIDIYSNTVGNVEGSSEQPSDIQLYNVALNGSVQVGKNTFVGVGAQTLVRDAPDNNSTSYQDDELLTAPAGNQPLSVVNTVPLLLTDEDPLVDPAYIYTQLPALAATGVDPTIWFYAVGWHENIDPDAYFNTKYYLSANPDVAQAGVNPLQHFETYGWKEGRNPASNFNTADYIAANHVVGAAAVDPLVEYLTIGKGEGLTAFSVSESPDPLIDAAYVYAHNPGIAVSGMDATTWFDTIGWKEGANPNGLFDTTYYLRQNPDVAKAGVNPLQHFEAFGWREGREPSLLFSDAGYEMSYHDVAIANVDPLLHYVTFGQGEGRSTSLSGGLLPFDPLVDPTYYDGQLGATLIPTGSSAAQQAAFSYHTIGWKEGLNPNSLFDTAYYLAHNPDVQAAHVDPLLHYETFGWKEGRDPSAQFSTSGYLASYADVRASGIDPLLSYVQSGASGGRNALGVHASQ